MIHQPSPPTKSVKMWKLINSISLLQGYFLCYNDGSASGGKIVSFYYLLVSLFLLLLFSVNAIYLIPAILGKPHKVCVVVGLICLFHIKPSGDCDEAAHLLWLRELESPSIRPLLVHIWIICHYLFRGNVALAYYMPWEYFSKIFTLYMQLMSISFKSLYLWSFLSVCIEWMRKQERVCECSSCHTASHCLSRRHKTAGSHIRKSLLYQDWEVTWTQSHTPDMFLVLRFCSMRVKKATRIVCWFF